MTRFRRGLVVGKFAPLHRGHELVLSTARDRCDELWVMSYSRPELPGCGPERRAHWLAALFPEARRWVLTDEAARGLGWPGLPDNGAPDEAHRRFVAEACLRLGGGTVDAVFTSEGYGEGFAPALTAWFRRRDPQHPEVSHVLVDRDRRQRPISGTDVRADVHANRAWLSPVVYASFVERICVLGGESSGKTTLAAALADALGTRRVPEYGRQLWDEKAGALDYEDLLAIARRQIDDEERGARDAARFLVCDTSPLTTLFYSRFLFGRADPELERLARRRYHHVFLCAPDFPFVQDGTRQDHAFRARQHAFYEEALADIPHVLLTGPVGARVVRACAHLGVVPRPRHQAG